MKHDTAPGQVEAPPPEHDTAPGQVEAPPPEHDTAPGQVEAPPPKHDTAPGQVEAPPPEHDTAPGQVEAPPPEHDTALGQVEAPPPEHDTAPGQVQAPLGTGGGSGQEVHIPPPPKAPIVPPPPEKTVCGSPGMVAGPASGNADVVSASVTACFGALDPLVRDPNPKPFQSPPPWFAVLSCLGWSFCHICGGRTQAQSQGNTCF
uniref:Uncharacterized protein n=1 Tax=Esox lucius TaxID=8010 RepID=A0AAY5K223_ESOLU